MILTEIKHLNVRISEFEEPIFDKNILPVFITPLILKEVEARKKSKHKIETLNPAKKLNFKVVSFNEIVEELAARINKIAIDLEPHYFIDPSYYNSLPYEVRAILNKNTLKDEKKVIAEASYRIALSTLRGKKHILYARCKVTKRRYRKGYRALYRYNKSSTVYGSYSEAANVRGENIKPILKKKNINKYRKLNFFPVTLRSATATTTQQSGDSQLLFSGWIPTSKGALMLLEDEGWDLDLLSNKNKASQRLKKIRPYSLRELRRLRRLRRLRLMSINLYLHRSNNAKKNNFATAATSPIKASQNVAASSLAQIQRGQSDKQHSNQEIQVADLENQGRNNSNIYKINYELSQPLPMGTFHTLTYPNQRTEKGRMQPINLNKRLNNKYLIKRNDNKLKFIINWIGDNLSYSDSLLRSTNSQSSVRSLTYPLQRLDKKNISELFLVQTKKPIKLPTLEVLELPELPVLNKKQEALARVVRFKAAKENAKEKAKLYLAAKKHKYLRRLIRNQKKDERRSNKNPKKGSFWYQGGGELRPSSSSFSPYGAGAVRWRSAHTLAATYKLGSSFSISFKEKATLAQSQSKANFTSRLSAIKSKVNNWKKKKDLSAILLQKINQRYVNLQLQNSNFFSDTYFPVNRKQVVDNYAKNLYIQNFKKIKSLAKVTQPKAWENIASLLNSALSTPLPNNGLIRGRASASITTSNPSLLPSQLSSLPKSRNTRRSTRLFWSIIKLYSSSFNPIFNSLNNKYLTLPGFLGKSTAQIKILKNNSSNDPLSPTELTVKKGSTTLIRGMTSAHSAEESKPIRDGAVAPSQERVKKNKVDQRVAGNVSTIKQTAIAPKPVTSRGEKKTLGTEALKRDNKPLLDKVAKAKATKAVSAPTLARPYQFQHTAIRSEVLRRKGSGLLSSKVTVIPHTAKSKANSVALAPSETFNHTSYVASPYLTDNKRFLFLYFIVPIFFATLKNSIAGVHSSALRSAQPSFSADKVSAAVLEEKFAKAKESHALTKPTLMVGPWRVEKRTQKNLTNQRKQLRALIKLMLDSGSALLRSRQLIRRNRALQSYAHLRELQKNKIKISTTHHYAAKSIGVADQGVDVVVRRSTDLLKWSVSLIAQSLAPLKRKDEYYSLIFIKILKTRGFLNLNKKKTKASHLLQQRKSKAAPQLYKSAERQQPQNKSGGYAPSRTLRGAALPHIRCRAPKGGTAAHSKQLVLQSKNKISLLKKGRVKPAAIEVDTKKIPLITFYPGGRYISDWKRVEKVIWQEEYKFNAVYRRAKNSLNLTKINTKKKLNNRYTIITVLKLWNIIKITSIKSVASLKLQVNFIKYGCTIKTLGKTLKKKRTAAVFLRINELTKGSGLYSLGSEGSQVNFLENLKYLIIKLILNVLETMHIKNRARLLSIRPRSLIKPANINSLLYDGGGSYLLKKTEDFIANIIQQQFSFLFYNNFIPWIKLNIFFKQREATNATNLNKKLTLLIKYIDSQVPLIFSIHTLDTFKKLGFLSKDISLPVARTGDNTLPSLLPSLRARSRTQSQITKYFTPIRSIEFYKSYNNLVNAKLTIIGKIRSIKLVELLDKIKEANIRAEELAALKRVADITNLNLINKKKSRRLNSSKYLNKKNILLSNRIKILQTIETIKTDFIFEPKLDSNALSKIPVSLLYYSNLQPLVISGSAASQRSGANPSFTDAAAQTIEVEKPPVISSFLRELSIYNRETKGIINYFSKIVSYNFNANNNKISSSITDLLEASFKVMHCLISKPVFVITPEKVTIQLFYFLMVANKKQLRKIRKRLRSRFNNKGKQRIYNIYKKKRLIEAKNLNLYNLNEVFSEQFELLCGRLNKIFNKPVELNLIRLHYPTEDSNILVNFMDILINKVTLAQIYKKLFRGTIIKSLITLKKRKYNDISIIPAFLTGLNIKIAGRIMTQKVKPRKTINLKHRGATASGKINYLNFARLTNKNKRGSYSITVSAGQNYFK